MRVAALVLVSALALAACGKQAGNGTAAQNSTPAANPGGVIGAMFPNLFQASYRADGQVIRENGQTMPITMIRSGPNMRMEMDTGREGRMAIIRNASTHEMYTIMTMAGRQIAMQTDTSTVQDPFQAFANHEDNNPHIHIAHGGPCLQAGETGSEWTVTNDEETTPRPHTACVTTDGIILQAKDGDRVTWQTTHIQRGPQDPALFALPPGVQVMNARNIGAIVAGMRGANKPAGQ